MKHQSVEHQSVNTWVPSGTQARPTAVALGVPGGGQGHEGQPRDQGHPQPYPEALAALGARGVLRRSPRDRQRLALALAHLVALHPQLTDKYRGRELACALDYVGCHLARTPDTLAEAWRGLAWYASYLVTRTGTSAVNRRKVKQQLVADLLGGPAVVGALSGLWWHRREPEHTPEPDLRPAIEALSALGRCPTPL
jgi:hypothetical protein